MTENQILAGKHALVFGAGGSIGSAVAKEFAAAGAEVFLSGRNKSTVESVAKQIETNGGKAHSAVVDTLDEASVNQYVEGVNPPTWPGSTLPTAGLRGRLLTRSRPQIAWNQEAVPSKKRSTSRNSGAPTRQA